MKNSLSKVKRYLTVLNILAIITITFALLTIYSLVSPFNPMSIRDVNMKPEQVCPLQLVGVNGKTDLTSGRYRITVDPLWIKINGDRKVLDESQVDGNVSGPIEDADASNELVYVSPPERGNWRIKFDITVQGRRGILPREQDITVLTDNVLHVVDCGDTYRYEELKHKG